MRIKATGADPLIIAFAIYAACTSSLFWMAAIPFVIGGWFFHPRYDSDKGWRFLHDDESR